MLQETILTLQVLEKLTSTTDAEDTLKDQIGAIKGEYDGIVQKENAIKASKIDQDQEIEKYAAIVKV